MANYLTTPDIKRLSKSGSQGEDVLQIFAPNTEALGAEMGKYGGYSRQGRVDPSLKGVQYIQQTIGEGGKWTEPSAHGEGTYNEFFSRLGAGNVSGMADTSRITPIKENPDLTLAGAFPGNPAGGALNTAQPGVEPIKPSTNVASPQGTFALTSGNLQEGNYNNENVKQLQGLLGITTDGDFGPKTKEAVMAFQKANGLKVDGIVGPETMAALNKTGTQGQTSNILTQGQSYQGGTVGFDTATGQPLAPGETTFADPAAAINDKYKKEHAEVIASGMEAPPDGGTAKSIVQGGLLPGKPQNPVLDTLFQEDKNIANFSKQIQDYLSPQTQQKSLKQEYESLMQAQGIQGLNTELMNMKNVIEGAEDDIRGEITKAGGFATESQVLALTNARNKTLIKNYNNLLQTKQQAEDYIKTVMGLEETDRSLAQDKLDKQLNLSIQLVDMQQKMKQNAQSTLNNVVSQVGYAGLAQMAQGNPYYTGLIEQTLGLGQGGLAKLAAYTPPVNEMEQLKLEQARMGLTTEALQQQKLLGDIKEQVRGTGVSTDPSQILAYAQQYAADGKIPTGLPKGTFGLVSQVAQELPKTPGQILSTSTGVPPSGDATLQGALGSLYSAVELAKQLKELDTKRSSGLVAGTLGKLFGSEAQTTYMDLRSQIVDLLSRARSGAALTPSEEKRYGDMLPGRFSESLGLGADSQTKINNFVNTLTSDASNKASAQGWAINGLSSVTIGEQKYKVGDVIKNESGQQGRVNANGTITITQ